MKDQPVRELVTTCILYNNTRILCVCLSVSLSNMRYLEREVVSPRRLHHLEVLLLASCTNCFSSLYDARFERKNFWKFSSSQAGYPQREVVSPRCLHNLEERGWRVAQTAFQAYTTRGSSKSLCKLFVSYTPNSVHAPINFQLPWVGLILLTTRKALEHSGRVRVEGHALHV